MLGLSVPENVIMLVIYWAFLFILKILKRDRVGDTER